MLILSEVLATGALGSLQNERFQDLGINFNQFYEVDESSPISLSSDKTSLTDISSDYQSSPESITDWIWWNSLQSYR